VPKPAWAAMAALALLVVFVPMMRQPEGPAQVVTVTALRGGDEVMARANSPIQLQLEMTALDVPEPVKVQIVDRNNSEIWSGTASKTTSYQVNVGRLEEGMYWVRVSDPANASELLREFRLLVN
jgi:hypothetical protein